jgi:hypothetical protein
MATITDQPTRVEIEEALAALAQRAAREFPVIGMSGAPTPYDRRHEQIDQLLTEWQAATRTE